MSNFQIGRMFTHGDNLDFLRGMNSKTVHLIATDPPFNKNRDFHATPESLAKGSSFTDRWRWERDVHLVENGFLDFKQWREWQPSTPRTPIPSWLFARFGRW